MCAHSGKSRQKPSPRAVSVPPQPAARRCNAAAWVLKVAARKKTVSIHNTSCLQRNCRGQPEFFRGCQRASPIPCGASGGMRAERGPTVGSSVPSLRCGSPPLVARWEGVCPSAPGQPWGGRKRIPRVWRKGIFSSHPRLWTAGWWGGPTAGFYLHMVMRRAGGKCLGWRAMCLKKLAKERGTWSRKLHESS